MKPFFFLLIFLTSFFCKAQELPKPLKLFSEKGEGIVKDSDLTDAQKKYLWNNVKQERNGILRIKSSKAYTDLISTFLKHPLLKNELPDEFIIATKNINSYGYSFLGAIHEDKFRTTVIYSNAEQSYLMFTKWKYRDSGATITISEGFINRSIGNVPAVLSLMSDDDEKAIWKCTWWKEGVNYEFYATDKKDKHDNPFLSSELA